MGRSWRFRFLLRLTILIRCRRSLADLLLFSRANVWQCRHHSSAPPHARHQPADLGRLVRAELQGRSADRVVGLKCKDCTRYGSRCCWIRCSVGLGRCRLRCRVCGRDPRLQRGLRMLRTQWRGHIRSWDEQIGAVMTAERRFGGL